MARSVSSISWQDLCAGTMRGSSFTGVHRQTSQNLLQEYLFSSCTSTFVICASPLRERSEPPKARRGSTRAIQPAQSPQKVHLRRSRCATAKALPSQARRRFSFDVHKSHRTQLEKGSPWQRSSPCFFELRLFGHF